MRYRRLGMALLAIVVIAIPLQAFGNHDDGDGSEACNFGEICLFDLTTTNRWTNHFWWDATYGTHYTWYDTVDNHYESALVDDDMSSARNRDSSCDAWFHNYGTANWLLYNDGVQRDAPAYFNQTADLHERVNCS